MAGSTQNIEGGGLPQGQGVVNAERTREQAEVNTLSEGRWLASSRPKERGVTLVNHYGDETDVAVVGPMDAEVYGIKPVTVERPGGGSENQLEVSLLAVSPEQSRGLSVSNLRLGRDALRDIVLAAKRAGIDLGLPQSKWAPGGKMEELADYALRLDKKLGD